MQRIHSKMQNMQASLQNVRIRTRWLSFSNVPQRNLYSKANFFTSEHTDRLLQVPCKSLSVCSCFCVRLSLCLVCVFLYLSESVRDCVCVQARNWIGQDFLFSFSWPDVTSILTATRPVWLLPPKYVWFINARVYIQAWSRRILGHIVGLVNGLVS